MKKYLGLTIMLCVFLSVIPAMAIPNLQVWSPNWTSVGDSGSDQDTGLFLVPLLIYGLLATGLRQPPLLVLC